MPDKNKKIIKKGGKYRTHSRFFLPISIAACCSWLLRTSQPRGLPNASLPLSRASSSATNKRRRPSIVLNSCVVGSRHSEEYRESREQRRGWILFLSFYVFLIRWNRINIFLKNLFYLRKKVIEGRNCLAFLEMIARRLLFIYFKSVLRSFKRGRTFRHSFFGAKFSIRHCKHLWLLTFNG
jgi:hypothetical protein